MEIDQTTEHAVIYVRVPDVPESIREKAVDRVRDGIPVANLRIHFDNKEERIRAWYIVVTQRFADEKEWSSQCDAINKKSLEKL